jgi:hypothetical protein
MGMPACLVAQRGGRIELGDGSMELVGDDELKARIAVGEAEKQPGGVAILEDDVAGELHCGCAEGKGDVELDVDADDSWEGAGRERVAEAVAAADREAARLRGWRRSHLRCLEGDGGAVLRARRRAEIAKIAVQELML